MFALARHRRARRHAAILDGRRRRPRDRARQAIVYANPAAAAINRAGAPGLTLAPPGSPAAATLEDGRARVVHEQRLARPGHAALLDYTVPR